VFLVMLAFPLAMTALAIYAGLHARRRAALVRNTPTSYVTSAEPGYRQFEGHVEAIDRRPLEAPLTKSACVWYHARVEKLKRRSGSDSQDMWTTVRELTSDAPFFVRDGAGVATVQPYGAEVTPTDKSVWYGTNETPDDRNPPRVKPPENPAGMVEIAGGTVRFRYFEERIYDGDPLVVLGYFSRRSSRPGDDVDDDEVDDQTVGDGEESVDPEEAFTEQLSARAAILTDAVIERGSGAEPFMFSTTPKDQHAELTELGGRAALGVAVVPLGLAALLLWVRFG
jgi:hypothetical protein